MKSKHTKGPWIWEENLLLSTDKTEIKNNDNIILALKPRSICYDEDASLIAAAPEMLEALKAILPEMERCYSESNLDWYFVDKVKSIINRAKGE